MNLEQTHKGCKFVMYQLVFITFILLKAMALQKGKISHYVGSTSSSYVSCQVNHSLHQRYIEI
jgi:hypothetical protein